MNYKILSRVCDSLEPGSPEYNRDNFKKFWSPKNKELDKTKTYYVTIETFYGQNVYRVQFSDGEWMYEYQEGDWAGLQDFYNSPWYKL